MFCKQHATKFVVFSRMHKKQYISFLKYNFIYFSNIYIMGLVQLNGLTQPCWAKMAQQSSLIGLDATSNPIFDGIGGAGREKGR